MRISNPVLVLVLVVLWDNWINQFWKHLISLSLSLSESLKRISNSNNSTSKKQLQQKERLIYHQSFILAWYLLFYVYYCFVQPNYRFWHILIGPHGFWNHLTWLTNWKDILIVEHSFLCSSHFIHLLKNVVTLGHTKLDLLHDPMLELNERCVRELARTLIVKTNSNMTKWPWKEIFFFLLFFCFWVL